MESPKRPRVLLREPKPRVFYGQLKSFYNPVTRSTYVTPKKKSQLPLVKRRKAIVYNDDSDSSTIEDDNESCSTVSAPPAPVRGGIPSYYTRHIRHIDFEKEATPENQNNSSKDDKQEDDDDDDDVLNHDWRVPKPDKNRQKLVLDLYDAYKMALDYARKRDSPTVQDQLNQVATSIVNEVKLIPHSSTQSEGEEEEEMQF